MKPDIKYFAGVIAVKGGFYYEEGRPLRVIIGLPSSKRDILGGLMDLVGGGSLYRYMSGSGQRKKAYYRLAIQSYKDIGKFIELFAAKFYYEEAAEFDAFVKAFRKRAQTSRAGKAHVPVPTTAGATESYEARVRRLRLTPVDSFTGQPWSEKFLSLQERFPGHPPVDIRMMLDGEIPIPVQESPPPSSVNVPCPDSGIPTDY